MTVNIIWEGGWKLSLSQVDLQRRFVGEGCPINHPECGYEAIKLDFQYETSQKFHEPGRYSTSHQEEPTPQYQGFSEPPRFQQTPIVDNSILGSGNFEILKGGTFYDKNDYRQYRWWKMSDKLWQLITVVYFQPQHEASELRVWTEWHLPQLPRLCRHQEGELSTREQI